MMADSTAEVRRHSRLVKQYVTQIAHALIHGAEGHDLDKLESRIKKLWDAFSPHLKVLFGSPEYTARKVEMRNLLDDHYARTRHHPEHFGAQGVAGMTLMELAEYLADNYERCKTLGDGNLRRSLEMNREPHHIDPQTMQILLHTAEYFGWLT